jgi:type VI secretion system protein ImpA
MGFRRRKQLPALAAPGRFIMTAPALLDFPVLLAPIAGDDPSGSPVPPETRHQLEEARREDNPDDYAPGDPMRPETFRKADWAGIVRLAEDTLRNASKDLLVAARLTEALVQLHGFPGLRDGSRLLRELVDECWDRLRPPVEDGDLEVRAGPFFWLDDPDKGARFPTTLRRVPLVFGEEGQAYGWLEWRHSQAGTGPVSREDFDRAVAATPAERVAEAAEALRESREELQLLTGSLAERMGAVAPGLAGIHRALEECQHLAQQILHRKGPAPGEAAPGGQEGPAGAADGASPSRAAVTRAEAYRQLAQAADLLQRLEPHSPIPYLVRRAVELGALPFPQLMKALIRDANVLGELSRELGIKESDGSG